MIKKKLQIKKKKTVKYKNTNSFILVDVSVDVENHMHSNNFINYKVLANFDFDFVV